MMLWRTWVRAIKPRGSTKERDFGELHTLHNAYDIVKAGQDEALARAQRAEAERDALAERLEKLLHTHETERAADIAIARALALDEFTKVTGHHE